MIKTTFGKISALCDTTGHLGTISRLGGTDIGRVSISDAVRLMRFLKALSEAAREYAQERLRLAETVGVPEPGHSNIRRLPPEKMAELYAVECDIPVAPLPLSALEGAPITAGDLLLLEPFLLMPDVPAPTPIKE